MAETYLPNPSTTIVYFLLTTVCFLFFTIYSVLQTQDISKASEAMTNNISNAVYILLLVVGSYFVNATISKSMCSQSIQWSYVLMITLLPWIIIFVSLYFILTIFPGWISPFSNTIGYLIIGFLGVDKIYNDIFKTSAEDGDNPELVKAIANMNSNRTKFINQINIKVEDFINFFQNMKDTLKPGVLDLTINTSTPVLDPTINTSTLVLESNIPGKQQRKVTVEAVPGKEMGFTGGQPTPDTDSTADSSDHSKNALLKLYQLLVIKHIIGKIVWYILAGILISSISYNLVISMACEKSLEEIEKDFETARVKAEQDAESQQS